MKCMMQSTQIEQPFVVCIRNTDYQAALELRKMYQTLPDQEAEKVGFRRIIDESGDDYLYPADFFVDIVLPATIRDAVLKAA